MVVSFKILTHGTQGFQDFFFFNFSNACLLDAGSLNRWASFSGKDLLGWEALSMGGGSGSRAFTVDCQATCCHRGLLAELPLARAWGVPCTSEDWVWGCECL